MATKTGKRYACKECGAEYIVTKAGKSDVKCCGKQMNEKGK